MTADQHDYKPGTDRPCLVCGSGSERMCKRRQRNELERHRFSFEGATSLLAQHLIDDHGADPLSVSPWCTGLSQGDWVALDNLHQAEHEKKEPAMSDELSEAAQRVTGYVRAWQLLSNVDPALIGEVHVMPAGSDKPMEFALFTKDLEALAAHAATVNAAELRRLQESDEHLNALFAAGVDNWDGYVGPVRR